MTPFRETISIRGATYAKVKPKEGPEECGEMTWSSFKLVIRWGLLLLIAFNLGPAISVLLTATIPASSVPEWLNMFIKSLDSKWTLYLSMFFVLLPYYFQSKRQPIVKDEWFPCSVLVQYDGIEVETFRGQMRVSTDLVEFEGKDCCFQFGFDAMLKRDPKQDSLLITFKGPSDMGSHVITISGLPFNAGTTLSDLMWAVQFSREVNVVLPPIMGTVGPYTSWRTLMIWHGLLFAWWILFFCTYDFIKSFGKSFGNLGKYSLEIFTFMFFLTGLVYCVRIHQIRDHKKRKGVIPVGDFPTEI